ncbi:OsmC family protein [Nocardia sp. alder85J]|uniref:OsmC family protein n=1 Tax=Nocardia sp. alder85J TaxID=2862949 RepID=UPI001CD7DCFA|nr:OsmC family protein [Nocardia sp. alder85J]MCX4092730.1 OsmC family protein [Nocardia sp. alder85J]
MSADPASGSGTGAAVARDDSASPAHVTSGAPAPAANNAAAEDNSASVSAHTIAGTPGRYVLDARANHLITDSRFGSGEAVRAGELLLGALVSCALANIENNAATAELPITGVRAEATHARDPEDPTRYVYTRMTVRVGGVDQPTAEALAAKYAATCPIYNTVLRGSGIELAVFADRAR